MALKNIDYSKTVIYSITCKDTSLNYIYVGNTTDFNTRRGNHERHCNNPNDPAYNTNIYTIIRANGGWDNFQMLLIEHYPCNNGIEAKTRENYNVIRLHATMNTIKPISNDDTTVIYLPRNVKKKLGMPCRFNTLDNNGNTMQPEAGYIERRGKYIKRIHSMKKYHNMNYPNRDDYYGKDIEVILEIIETMKLYIKERKKSAQ